MECPKGSHHTSGPLRGTEILVLVTYIFSIGLLVTGPSHLFASRFTHPPWFLDKAVYAPLIGLLFLVVASLCYDHESIIEGSMITAVIREKFSVILLILSFAYLSISLDVSGFFKVSALSMVQAAKGDGLRLLVYFYLMCSFLTYFTSNDIVIISMTPIVVHTCTVGIQDCVPLLITQFIAANTASMGLLLGSPSNIILGDAVGLSFMRYWGLMMLPTIVAIASTLFMVMVVFVWLPTRGHVMQRRFSNGEPGGHGPRGHGDERSAPVSVSSPVEEDAQAGTDDGGGGGGGGGDVELVLVDEGRGPSRLDRAQSLEERAASLASDEEEAEVAHTLLYDRRVRRTKVAAFFLVLLLLSISDYIGASLWSVSLGSAVVMLVADIILVHRGGKSPLSYLHVVYHRMPWAIAPFVVCMFLLVQALSKTGFVHRFARWMIAAAGDSFFSQAMVYGLVSGLLVNVLNDLPSTVFWSLMTPTLCSAYSARQYTGVIMALLVGVNPGCYLTIIGALAGLMWRNIIRSQPGVSKLCVPTAWDLTYYGGLVLLPVTFMTCASVAIIAPFAKGQP